MKTFLVAFITSSLLFIYSGEVFSQGDVRSATGMPIPIGAPVIWGRIELRGLKSYETKPAVFVTLLVHGAQVARAQADDRGYYFMLEKIREGAVLFVTVGGEDVGQQALFLGGAERNDFTVNWAEGARPAPQNKSIRSAYPRSETNGRLFDQAVATKLKDKNEAVKIFTELLTRDTQDFVAWAELGSLYFAQSRHTDAARAYESAIKIKPDYSLALMNLGKLHMTTKSYEDAVIAFNKAITADPRSPDAYHYLGEAHLQLKQGSKAVPVLNEAIRLDPVGKADIHLRLAALYNAAGLKDRAAAEYKLFIAKKPDYAERAKLEKYIKENLK
ncbi:MAG: tetratricopeptide repeat protein [Pyrinomonadaceae bacterium]